MQSSVRWRLRHFSVAAQRQSTWIATAVGVLVTAGLVYASDRSTRLNPIALAAGVLVYLVLIPLLVWATRAVGGDGDARRARVVRELRRAVRHGELSLEFQPLVDLRTGAVKSAEALIRWDHPERGRIAPDEFIPIAESSAFFWDFSLHVLDLALAGCAECRRQGVQLAVAVNVSSGNLLDTRLPDELRRLLAKYSLPSTTIELEVTEGAIMEQTERAERVLDALAEVGVGRIAIDDFGTGHSSLARVRALPIDALKIDKSFIAEMDATGDSAMVRSVIALAHNLGLIAVAEGIENRETYERLARLGCDLGQGYCISSPLTLSALRRWVEDRGIGPQMRIEEDDDDRRRGPGRRRNDYFAVAFDNAPEAMMIADDAGRWVDANVAACEMLGVSREALRLRRWGAFSPPAARGDLDQIWATLVDEGHALGRWLLQGGDGRQIPIEYEATGNFLPGLHLFVMRVDGLTASTDPASSGSEQQQ
jgi:PAS domain S-box-containing protein